MGRSRPTPRSRCGAICLLAGVGISGAGMAAVATTSAPLPDLPDIWATAIARAAADDPDQGARSAAKPPGKDYWLPAEEIVGFDFLLNQYNRHFAADRLDYASNINTIRHNLHSSWVIDSDPFRTNQLGHPYQGSIYHTFARSAGMTYWESLGYTFAGSAFWEIAGERTPPSRNDQINTGIGGTFLGEALFRMAHVVLAHDDWPPLVRELGAAVVSPATGFNRLAFGDRFRNTFDSHDPVHYSRLQVGFSGSTQNEAGLSTTRLKRGEALVDYSMEYGMPGKDGYTYDRPFDYFNFQATASSANGFENVMTRGMLIGKDYRLGADYRGIYGLYGNYDYIAPQTFRVSSTALSLGTTGQWWATRSVALQGTALMGAGFTAVGTTRSSGDKDYHYGLAPQALLALRFIFGENVSLDLTGREYFVSRVGAAARGGHDNIVRADATMTVRVHRQHAVSIKYLGNRRDAFYPDVGDSSQSRGTIGIFYTWLGHEHFGAVDWR
ncbi:MAG TPA: DUF3943 domain-containing protein [Casimicrobiaceae bacterium]|nr:DUF3943 domain-containing protein [Casimicrobiaceae bacterium]